MIHVLAQVEVEDFDVFFSGFESRGFPLRKQHGSLGSQVFRHADEPEKVSILFRWESRESMKKGGTVGPPKITFLEQSGELEA